MRPTGFPAASFQRLCAAAVLLALGGCGGRVYEGRLAETSKYFEFIEKQNINLAKSWTGSGMSFRVPAQFKLIPGPKVTKDKQGNVTVEEPDPRQPDFIDGKFPGIVAAWKADFNVTGQQGTVPGYIYLLSNYDLWLDADQKETAEKFHSVAVQQIASQLKTSRPKDEKWVTERFPRSESYIDQKAYTVAVLDPRPEIHDLKHDVTIYLAKSGDIQVVLMSIVPQGILPGRKTHFQDVSPTERMALALETFTSQGQRPKKSAPGSPASSGTPGARSPF